MREQIQRFMQECPEAKSQVFANNAFGSFVRTVIPEKLYETGLIDRDQYLITGSVGQGNWVTIPWIAIFDKSITTSAQKGIYIVYLLSSDSKRLYLSFNQGCTEIKKAHGKKETITILEEKAEEIRSIIDVRRFSTERDIDLGDRNTGNGVFYEKGDILHTVYKIDNIPEEKVLLDDLSRMMAIYQEYVQHQSSNGKKKRGVFGSWTIVDEDTAIKKCDKSFYDYNGSAVTKEISWFFGADNLEQGQVVTLKLSYEGKEYGGLVRNELSDQRRVRIFWNTDLGKLFAEYQKKGEATATFHRIGNNAFEITMKGDEAEVSVKEQIAQIKAYIAARGFSYDDGLIENFYLSLKSKPFVILAGTSGTGKSRLVRLFAEAIGAEFSAVPVRPDWSDSTDLFGHVDLNGKFVAGKILDFLWEARENPNRPFLLCLDEMNLARVEYYMSDFLSVIETRDWLDNNIVSDPLVSEKDYGKDTSAANHYGEIRFPENLYIVGTVNMDETTFQFSRKVLDRANTIEFNYVNLLPKWSDSTGDAIEQKLDNDFLRSQYLLLTDCSESDQEYVSGVCVELEKINSILSKANAHVGYRVRDEIVFYLMNNRMTGLLDENNAMDNEILQKILPRIHGSSASVKSMLCDLFKKVAADYEGYQTESNNTAERMLDMLQKNKHVKYPRSAEKIAFMVRRFEEDGFTSYWL